MNDARTAARAVRARAVAPLADHQGGIVSHAQLRDLGIDRFAVRNEISAGRWVRAGRHTVIVDGRRLSPTARLWWAVWESGSGAVLDGASALLAHGMTGFTAHLTDVSVPARNHAHRLDSVRLHRPDEPPGAVVLGGVPRVLPALATIHAAQWAVSDRQAALLLCLPVQQRLVTGEQLLGRWRSVTRSPRRSLINGVLRDLVDGAESLGELDFAALCRSRGLPQPRRQSLRRLSDGRAYLDVEFAEGLVVEIDGAHHLAGLTPVDDALRANEVTLGSSRVLRIPLLGLRTRPDAFMAQVSRALRGFTPDQGPAPAQSA